MSDGVSAVAAGINSTIKILEVCFLLKAVGEQTIDLLRTTEHVNRNIIEARRLRRLKASLISTDERAWMDAAIQDTEQALIGVAQLIEPARVDLSTLNSVSSKNRVLWVFKDSPKVRDKHNRLHICHQTLIAVINGLHAKDVVVVAPLPAGQPEDNQPPPYSPEMEAIFNWRSQKRRRKSSTNVNAQVASPTSPSSTSDSLSPPFLRPDLAHSDSALARQDAEALNPRLNNGPWDESMSATALPSAFYSSLEGIKGFQVQGFRPGTDSIHQAPQVIDQDLPSSRLLSPVSLLPQSSLSSPSFPSQDTNMHPPVVPATSLATNSLEKECDIAGSGRPQNNIGLADYAPGISSTPVLNRRSTRSRGQQWLVSYASQSDINQSVDRG